MANFKIFQFKESLKVWALRTLLATPLLLTGCEGGTSKAMQEDFDRIRLDHALVISELLSEYRKVTGRYPLAEGSDTVPTVVVIGTPEQLSYNEKLLRIRVDMSLRAGANGPEPPPPRVSFLPVGELEAEIGRALGRRISLPVDPQRVPVNKPSVYLYVLHKDVYDLSVFLHQSFSFSRPLGDFHNKVAVASKSLPSAGVWTAEELMRQSEFIEFFQRPFHRGGYSLQTVLPKTN